MDKKTLEIARECGLPFWKGKLVWDNEIVERFATRMKQEALLEAAQEFANDMDGSDVRDETINEKLWFACEHLRRMAEQI